MRTYIHTYTYTHYLPLTNTPYQYHQ